MPLNAAASEEHERPRKGKDSDSRENPTRLKKSVGTQQRRVAQPGRAPASGAGGRKFKSCRADHLTFV